MKLTNAVFDPDCPAAREPQPGEADYVYHDDRIALAVNVALATGRPLFVTGDPGSGKSTLGADVARRLGWAYLSHTITSRTRFDDLVARYDAVARLNDAQTPQTEVGAPADYVVPGVLWWAFGPDSAAGQPRAGDDPRHAPADADNGVVVVLDEIDKAEPDLPNDLLGPLDGYRLTVPGRGPIQGSDQTLVIITSNRERSMPPAFLRRCISLELTDLTPDFFTRVAESHYGPDHTDLYDAVAERTIHLVDWADETRRRRPSMAEYLDTIKACIDSGEHPGSPLWDAIEEAALRKTRDNPADTAADD